MGYFEIYAEVGQRIRHYRQQRNLSQDELSRLLSLSRSSLVNIEKGKHRIQLHILLGIAERLNVPLSNLLESIPTSNVVNDLPSVK
jgi:transcriptional regulator with XRE-family HTH domain